MTTTKRILIIVPQKGFDPSECAIPYAVLTSKLPNNNNNNHTNNVKYEFTVAVPDPSKPAHCDPIMIDGVGLYLFKWSMRADQNGRDSYKALEDSKLLDPPNTISYEDALARVDSFDGLLLPGGHCPDMIPYLESKVAQEITATFAKNSNGKKPIAAVCHGVVLAARAGILKDKRVTALEWWQEGLAHNLTRAWMGGYYKTYADRTVQSEVTAACKEFVKGPKGFGRDDLEHLSTGFFVRDGNILTARWPGDVHAFAMEFHKMLME